MTRHRPFPVVPQNGLHPAGHPAISLSSRGPFSCHPARTSILLSSRGPFPVIPRLTAGPSPNPIHFRVIPRGLSYPLARTGGIQSTQPRNVEPPHPSGNRNPQHLRKPLDTAVEPRYDKLRVIPAFAASRRPAATPVIPRPHTPVIPWKPLSSRGLTAGSKDRKTVTPRRNSFPRQRESQHPSPRGTGNVGNVTEYHPPSRVTRNTSSSVVSPCTTLRIPSSRRL